MTRTRTIAALALAAALLAGCGQGNYTRAHKNAAAQRLNQMKSATEWEMAHQAFLGGDREKALKRVDQSIELNPDVAKSHVLRGRILAELGDMEGAIRSFERASEIDENHVDAYYYLATVYERLSSPERALELYTKADALDPANPQHAVAAAEMLVDLGRPDEAEAFILDRPSLVHNAGARQTLGHLAMMRGDHERALAMFNEARLLAPGDTAIIENLVRAQIASGRHSEAEYHLARLLQNPDLAARRDLLHMRARCLLTLGRHLEARDALIALTQGDAGANDLSAWIELGNLAYALRDGPRLREASTRVVGLAPQRYEGHALRALSNRRLGKLPEALRSANDAVARRGDSVEPLILRGLILQDLGRYDDARSDFAQALVDDPDSGGFLATYPTDGQ